MHAVARLPHQNGVGKRRLSGVVEVGQASGSSSALLAPLELISPLETLEPGKSAAGDGTKVKEKQQLAGESGTILCPPAIPNRKVKQGQKLYT